MQSKVNEDQDDQLTIDSFDSYDIDKNSKIPKIQKSPLPEIPMPTDHDYEELQYWTKNIHQKLCKNETKIRSFPQREIIIGSQKNFRRILITDTFFKVKLQKKHPYRQDVSCSNYYNCNRKCNRNRYHMYVIHTDQKIFLLNILKIIYRSHIL